MTNRRNLKEFVFGESQPEASSLEKTVRLDAIVLPASQPRRYFDPEKLKQLTLSIQAHGILEPLLVRPLKGKSGHYELVAGERRYRAAQIAGLNEVPVTVRELNETEALQIALVENLQREDLNPVEETEGVLHLLAIALDRDIKDVPSILYRMQHQAKGNVAHNVVGNSEQEAIQGVFEQLGLLSWESFVNHRLPLLKLPKDILGGLREGKLAYTKAQAIARVKDEGERKKLLRQAIQKNWSLSEIKNQIKTLQKAERSEETPSISSRLDSAYRRVKKAKAWEDPKKRKRLEKLLNELESIVAEEDS